MKYEILEHNYMNMDQLNTTYIIVFYFKETETDIVLHRSYYTQLEI